MAVFACVYCLLACMMGLPRACLHALCLLFFLHFGLGRLVLRSSFSLARLDSACLLRIIFLLLVSFPSLLLSFPLSMFFCHCLVAALCLLSGSLSGLLVFPRSSFLSPPQFLLSLSRSFFCLFSFLCLSIAASALTKGEKRVQHKRESVLI